MTDTKKVLKIEEKFIESAKNARFNVAIYLVNGIKLQGKIEDFDDKTILLGNTQTQLVYKTAISTIVPSNTK
jgi:host factor-I protein